MIIIIPIGGIGQRFKDNGYTNPKALINVFGKSIISYLLDNLTLDKIDYIFIPYNKEYKNYNFEETLKKQYSHIPFKFFCLENNTRGAAETINIGIRKLNETRDIPIICLDSDNFYLCDIISQWNGDNCVFTFKSFNKKPIYSYVELNDKEQIVNIKEKDKISDYACTGAYGFKSIQSLEKYTSVIIEQNITQQNEFYTSGVIKEMITNGHNFKNITIDDGKFICLGTPLQLKIFYNNYPKNSSTNNKKMVNPKRFCFDLDNTLVTFPTIPNDYTTVKPITKNILFLKYLKRFGNTIIIYTARRMKTHNGNIGKINADIGKITFETLEKFDIPYDEIYFGKPCADFYIDDLAINCFGDIEKETGFYNNIIEPRDFNFIEEGCVDTIIKKGNLDGEIYYYENLPNNIKDLFPVYFGKNENSCYVIEKIKGITLSDLYLSELLTKNILINVLNSIIRIQQTECCSNNINIYENYYSKLTKRYNDYDYSLFQDSKIIYNELLIKLKEYENNKCGKKKIIHGDTVFTNILINNYDKIKFIDMRGKQGDILTIQGDWLYDWAKIYQSLIGYDEILLSKNINNQQYKNDMIECFKDFFINNFSSDDFNNLKTITKSLLFTLIPLHNNEKCKGYYNLIFSENLT
jgi:capsule biosynthesis phosphatase